MKKVKIYTSGFCGHCFAAKRLLAEKGIDFEEIDVTFNAKGREEMLRRAKRSSVPQIFIGDQPIGGNDSLHALAASGQLDELLKD